ncbi:UDP-glucuronate 4-epimerase [Clostridium punense]|uniref:UDP-glucuronate 4-epimerase n=1 Tax=Clostridium punense TaxID=1054297 RepID=A0ABS4K3Y1_9CLOT|nr:MULTISPECIES: NAD-dependent epimerase [Clostridium]EQB86574.1 hypothetical protein M918_13290 [Clostridium sp. BL8]MBP2022494.1 UDP-glucuronate 4-epimerase [Clostridium punense]
MIKIVVTGVGGFIGYHVSKYLVNNNVSVLGIDNYDSYYDVNLKKSRVGQLANNELFQFIKCDLTDFNSLEHAFDKFTPEYVIHLAAQAGVRYSIENPNAYIDSNLVGFMNVLEACRKYSVKHLIYASSSSVYGGNKVAPFSTGHHTDHPVSFYAATKKANELFAHSYSQLYGIPTTGLRFFTVYGPWGRPDLAYYKFTKKIFDGETIDVYNHGQMERDFTYIDDIVEGIVRLIDKPPVANPDWDETKDSISSSFAPYKVYNIGSSNPVKLEDFINILEKKIGIEAKKKFMDMQPGDVLRTYADVSDLEKDINFKPQTSLEEGLGKFVDWYREYYNV